MANQNLTHHEELRYNYLLRNFHYLSAKEKAEFEFLRAKVEAFNQQERPYRSYNYADSGASTQDYGAQADAWEDAAYSQEAYDDGYDDYDQAYTDQGLPLYEDKPPLPKVKKKRRTKDAVPAPAKVRKPRSKRKFVKRTFQVLLLVILVLLGGMGYRLYKGWSAVQNGNGKYQAAVKEVFNGEDTSDGTNILVLGSDQRVTQGSTDARTDSIMVVNVGNKDKKVKMVSFMRDTLVNIKGVSYSSTSYDQKLNVAFNLGEQDGHKGAEYMRRVLKANFGIKIKYYVMLDFETFAEAVDTLFPDGVEIDAKFATVEGQEVSEVQVPDDLRAKDGVTPEQTISVGKQKMDGRTLLNYARFRKDDEGDFGRTKRQQQVMSAVVSQVKDVTKLFSGSEAIGKVFAMTSTNLPYSFLLKNGASILGAASKGMEQKTIPENGDWVDDYDMYGGMGISIDFDHYRSELKKMGLE